MRSIKLNTFAFASAAFLIAALSPASTANCQSKPAASAERAKIDTLALVNGQPVTSEDFRNRFELSIYPGEDHRDTTKMKFLYSMIAEKLLSAAAADSREPLTAQEKTLAGETEEMFLRDALYRLKVLPKTKPTGAEVSRGLRISTYSYFVDAFYFPDSAYASKFYERVAGRKAFIYELADSLSIGHDTLEIGYGESTPEIENAFFGRRDGFISRPTFTVDGWVIFRVLARKTNPKFAGIAPADRMGKVSRIIQERNETVLGREYLMNLMKHVRVSVNYDLFRPLVYSIQGLMLHKHPTSFDPYYYLNASDLLSLREAFSRQLALPMLSFKGGSIALGEVFNELPLAGFHSADTTIPEITVGLHSALKFISQNYSLSKKAQELGLENSGEVRYNVRMFLDAFRSSRAAQEVTDTVAVTRAEVDNFFESHQDDVLRGVELKLKTFEATSINDAVEIYDRLLKEERRGLVDTSGTWMRASRLAEIGAVLANQPDGTIYGPIFNRGKFYTYVVIDKKSGITKEAIDHSIEVAEQMLMQMKKQKVLDEYIAGLAEKAGVKIFYPDVRSLYVTPVEMLTFRYIGFGGKILAVPLLYPREGWIEYYHPEKPLVP